MYDEEGNYVGPALGKDGLPKRKKAKTANTDPAGADAAAPPSVDPFSQQDRDGSLLSPFFTTRKAEAPFVQSFGEKEDTLPTFQAKDEEWVNPRLNPDMPKATNVMGACSYEYDDTVEIHHTGPALAPVARENVQRQREKEKEDREVERNRRRLALKKMSFNQREGRKRDLGQQSRDKNFVEEEKRILRQQFEP
eukprot:EG_transcript_21755